MKFAFCAAYGSDWRPGLAKASQRAVAGVRVR
jgi:hypothetical protein